MREYQIKKKERRESFIGDAIEEPLSGIEWCASEIIKEYKKVVPFFQYFISEAKISFFILLLNLN